MVIFVHGCFWHGHNNCSEFAWPKTNKEFWRKKILSNQRRDADNRAKLKAAGWRVIEIWECEIGRKQLVANMRIVAIIIKLLKKIEVQKVNNNLRENCTRVPGAKTMTRHRPYETS
jgi:G:T-mismatch repair DNA endonuclease (very short patch repair protein)